MMSISRKLDITLLLFGILLAPCAARLSAHSEQQILESLGKVEEWRNGVQHTVQANLYAKVLSLWNASWPTIVKLKEDESGVENGFSGSTDRPHSMSKQCSDDVRRLSQGLEEQEMWASKMVDASGKVPSGVFLGNFKWVGMYEECLGASSKRAGQQPENSTVVLGDYCLLTVGADMPGVALQVELGICIPRTCNSTDAVALFNLVLSDFTDALQAKAAVCQDGSPLPLDSGAIVVITILCVFGVLLLLGTCLDVTRNHCHFQKVVNGHSEDVKDYDSDVPLLGDDVESTEKFNFAFLQPDGRLYQFLMAFSMLANAKRILSLEQTYSEKNLLALNGIRVISLTWVMLGHTYIFGLVSTSNGVEFANLIKRFTFQVIINATVSVDTFFVLSGTLLSYLLLKEFRNKGGIRNIGWPTFFFHRFWRLTPLYMFVLAIYATLFKYFGSGPYWPRESDESCKNNWWTNLLYINNIVHTDKMCLTWSWYLSNDMQFFVLSAVFLMLLFQWAVIGGVVIFVFMLASSITTGVITYDHNYPPSTPGIFINGTMEYKWFQDVYFVPWCRINTYLIGILLGYLLYRTNCKLRIPRALVVLGWFLAAVCNLSVLYGLYEVARGNNLSPSVSALYGSVNRIAWGIGVAWVILACATGNGGFVNDLLSLPIMQPLSRLTYAAYLIHPMIMLWYYYNLKVPHFIEDISMAYLFLAHMFLSYICAFILSVAFESPMFNLERFLLHKRKNQD